MLISINFGSTFREMPKTLDFFVMIVAEKNKRKLLLSGYLKVRVEGMDSLGLLSKFSVNNL